MTTQAKAKVAIELQQAQAEGCCEPGCSPETCGSVEPQAEQKAPVVIAGASDEVCCEPGCSPSTCSSP